MGFPKQEYWSELPFPIPGDLPDPGIKSTFPALAGRFFTTEPPGKHTITYYALLYFSIYYNTDDDLASYGPGTVLGSSGH